MVNSPKLIGKYDLLAIIALTALLTICIVFIPSNIPRIVIGLPFVLFFPGYTLIAALFPRKEGLSSIERVALSFGLSLAVVPLVGLALNYAWEVSLYPMLISIAIFVVAMCVLTYFRRRQLAPEQRFEPRISLPLPMWRNQSRLDRVLSVILALAIIGAIGTLVYVIAIPKTGQRFTEFYILGSSGTAGDYPSDIMLGADADVIVGIANHEGEDVTYQVRIGIDGAELKVIEGMALHHGEKWEDNVVFAPIKAGDNQRVEFLLYRDGESEPYRELYLWIDVLNP